MGLFNSGLSSSLAQGQGWKPSQPSQPSRSILSSGPDGVKKPGASEIEPRDKDIVEQYRNSVIFDIVYIYLLIVFYGLVPIA